MTKKSLDIENSGIAVVVCKTLAELRQHQEAWNELYIRSCPQVPMTTYAWVSAFLEELIAGNHEWICILAYRNDRLIGVLPVMREIAPNQWLRKPILLIPFNDHTYATDLLIDSNKVRITVTLLLSGLESTWPNYGYIQFSRVPEGSPLLCMKNDWEDSLWIMRDVSQGAYLTVPKNYQFYRHNLSKNFRRNLNKARNKLAKLDNVRFEILRDTSNGRLALECFMNTEALSWKHRSGTAIASSPKLISFYSKLTSRLAHAGFLEWHFLKIADQPIAANLAVHIDQKIFIWKLGYDEAYANYSPGSLLLEYVIEFSENEGSSVDEIDFLTDFKWYDNWQMRRRVYYSIRIFPRNIISNLLYFVPLFVISVARTWYRTIRRVLRS